MRTDKCRLSPRSAAPRRCRRAGAAGVAEQTERALLRSGGSTDSDAPRRTPAAATNPHRRPVRRGANADRSQPAARSSSGTRLGRGPFTPPPSAADRIAASEAAIGSKPPVIADPGSGKTDFIAAARRAAQAAAVTAAESKAGGQSRRVPPRRQKTKLTGCARWPLPRRSSSSSSAAIIFFAVVRAVGRARQHSAAVQTASRRRSRSRRKPSRHVRPDRRQKKNRSTPRQRRRHR